MKLEIQKITDVELPSYAHKGDAAFDLRSSETKIINPKEKEIIKTGIKMAIPEGYVGLIWDRSGLAAKHAIHCLAGVIDSGYRGEIGVVLINLGKEPIEITKNMRIAQMLIQPTITANIQEVTTLDETKRNEGGFGSTGTH
jgi:dUTP pyrophosphatase